MQVHGWLVRIAAALAMVSATWTADGAFPDRPIRIVVGASPGSSPDAVARVVAARLTELLGQPAVVDNVAGGGGNIAAEKVARAPADGYTVLFIGVGPLYINKTLFADLRYDIEADFEPLTMGARTASLLVVPVTNNARSVDELVAHAKATPGGLRFGSAGAGTSLHVLGELFRARTGIAAVHVPYKSSAQLALDLVAGRLDFAFHNAAVVVPHIHGGRLRALAVTTNRRVAYAADLPTMVELGYHDFLFDGGSGFLVPKRTPRAVVDKLSESINAALRSQGVREQLASHFLEPASSTPGEFRAHIRREIERWAPIVRESAAKAD